jgi:choline dehydrogenase-like flavoprotein
MADYYDAIVVGSGATGGWAAKELTESGLRVALLEAGPALPFDPEASAPAESVEPARQPIQAHCYAFNERTSHLFVDDVENPYSYPEDQPFDWIRSRQVGGRMHLWGRMCLRMSDYELKAASRDGVGDDWPISYADLAPYYDRVERFMRVCGTAEGLPQIPDGLFAEPPQLSAAERRFKAAVESRWNERHVTGARIALAPPDAMLAAATETGRLTLCSDSVASRVLTGDGGTASGVAYVDRLSGQEREVSGRVVVLCASAIESTRLLLNSATADHPAGLGNSSGALGRYLMDHTYGIGLDGVLPQRTRSLADRTSYGCAIPSFRNVEAVDDVDFIRGYGVELQIQTPVAGPLGRARALGRRSDGRFWMRTFGEVLPSFENQVSVDPTKTDAWGIPIAHIACRYGENELKMAPDQRQTLLEMAEAAGLQIEKTYPDLAPPGLSIHEMGTARMGSDPNSSVLNPDNQTWDVANLFVTDGACFTSGGFQNPTLTMMALTVRACDHIVARLKKNEL